MERLKAVNLTKRFGEAIALDNLNLSVREGDIFCLLGPNGAGKTTTINLFMGFTDATQGEAFINGELVGGKGNITRKFISYIPEVVMLYEQLSALENLDYFSKLAGFKYDRPQLEQYLSQAGLQAEANKKRVGTFSKGMRQKVGIAIALAKNADVIFMDEPTSGLDPKVENTVSPTTPFRGRLTTSENSRTASNSLVKRKIGWLIKTEMTWSAQNEIRWSVSP